MLIPGHDQIADLPIHIVNIQIRHEPQAAIARINLDAASLAIRLEDGRVLVFESMGEPDDYFTEKYTFPALQDPQTMVSTDTILLGIGKPSYLFYGCYPKFIGRYVFEKQLVDLRARSRDAPRCRRTGSALRAGVGWRKGTTPTCC